MIYDMICDFDDGLINQVVRAQLQRSAKETWFPKEETGKGKVFLESVETLLTFTNHWKGWKRCAEAAEAFDWSLPSS